jgi:hypothetical protein
MQRWARILLWCVLAIVIMGGAGAALYWAGALGSLQPNAGAGLLQRLRTIPTWLILATIALGIAATLAWTQKWLATADQQRDAKTSAQVSAIAALAIPVVLVAAGWLDYLGIKHFWLTLTAIAPGFLIFQHGLYLFASKPKIIPRDDQNGTAGSGAAPAAAGAASGAAAATGTGSGETGAPGSGVMNPPGTRMAPGRGPRDDVATKNLKKAQDSADVQFGFQRIALDFFFPALLTVVAGLIPAYLIVHDDLVAQYFTAEVRTGLLLGTIGAYVYVMMTLGERTFQRDITTGVATWCGVQLLLGPLLGGLAAAVVATGMQLTSFTRQAVYFFAGLAPREMVNFLQTAVRRALAPDRAGLPVKLIPLQTIRGITERIESRLMEEGVSDGFMLAMAQPVRLYRNTPYDFRQLIAWMDDCLLCVFLPDHAEALKKQGISGAIDLAYYWVMNEGDKPATDRIAKIAQDIKFDPAAFNDLVRRMNEDPQVQLIWSLYYSVKDE